jgi:hypothetical protein
MSKQQLDNGVPLSSPPALYDFSNAQYLKKAVTVWPSCAVPFTTPPGFDKTIDLEQLGATRAGLTSSTPLQDITQGASNMCSAFAFAQGYSVKFALANAGKITPQLSPVYAYYLQRVEECTTTGVCPCPSCPSGLTCTSKCDPPCVDCGSYLLSATSIYQVGVCTSFDWPLTQEINAAPSDAARRAAAAQRVSTVKCVPVDDNLAASVYWHLSNESPVVIFMNVTPTILNWMQGLVSATVSDTSPAVTTTLVPFPSDSPTSGHVVCVTGYDAAADVFIVRNSYGFAWGAQGRFGIRRTDLNPTLIHEAAAIVSVV